MNWPQKSLDELGFVGRGRSRHRPRDAAHLYGGPYPFVQTGDIKHANLYITEFTQTYSEAGLAQSKLWEVGTLCITIAANIADTAVLGIDACFPDSVIGFVPDPNKADVRFIKYLFDAQLQKRFQRFTQGATQDNLSQAKLLSLKFPVPEDVLLQKRIADMLSVYDELIENNRRRIASLERAARMLYQEWFVRLRFPGHEHVKINDGVPEGWGKGKVSDLGQVVTGKTPSTKEEANYNGEIPFVKTPDMHSQIVVIKTEQSLSERGGNTQPNKFIPRGSVMVSCIGTLGVVSIASCLCQTNQQINSVVPNSAVARYYAYFALSDLKTRLEGIGGGATMGNVNKTKFSRFPLIIPGKTMLAAFHDAVETSFLQIETLARQNDALSRARDLLLPHLMNGEIAV